MKRNLITLAIVICMLSFAVPAFASDSDPAISTGNVTSIAADTATLHSTLSSQGSGHMLEYGFDLGLTDSYGSSESSLAGSYIQNTGYIHHVDAPGGKFVYVAALAHDSDGNIYVADTNNNRIQVFSSQGQFLRTWGHRGTCDECLLNPQGITVDSDDNVWVADVGGSSVKKTDKFGNVILVVRSFPDEGISAMSVANIAAGSHGDAWFVNSTKKIIHVSRDGEFLSQWGVEGEGPGLITGQERIAVDADDNVYLTTPNPRKTVDKFSSTGEFLFSFENVLDTGSYASFIGVDIDDDGNIRALEGFTSKLYRFAPDGTYIDSVTLPRAHGGGGYTSAAVSFDDKVVFYDNGSYQLIGVEDNGGDQIFNVGGYESTEFNPRNTSVDSDGNLYASDGASHTVKKFDSQGNFIDSFGRAQGDLSDLSQHEFQNIIAVYVDGDDNIYVADNRNLTKFTPQFEVDETWATEGTFILPYNFPAAIVQDNTGNFYISYNTAAPITKLSNDGTTSSSIGAAGTGYGELQYGSGLTIGSDSNLYVADSVNNKVVVYSTDDSVVREMSALTGPHSFDLPRAIAADGNGTLFIGDSSGRVRAYSENGDYITTLGLGFGDEYSNNADSITVAPNGDVILSQSYPGSIQIFHEQPQAGELSLFVQNLTCEKTYHYRAWARTDDGVVYGSDDTFTSGECPGKATPTTGVAVSVTDSTARITGTLTQAGGSQDWATFEYGTDTNYGQSSYVGYVFQGDVVQADLTSLTCNTTYHYRLKTENTSSISYGEDQTFTTLSGGTLDPNACLPSVEMSGASWHSSGSTTLYAVITDLGGGVATDAGFEIGTTQDNLEHVEHTVPTSMNFEIDSTYAACGPNTSYYARAFVATSAGTSYSTLMSFSTGSCPIPVTDLAVSIDRTDGVIAQGDEVDYELTVSNVGNTNTTLDDHSAIYILLPNEFEIGEQNNPDTFCMDAGPASGLGDDYWIDLFGEQHVGFCGFNEEFDFNVGESSTITLHGTASSNFVDGSTELKAYLISDADDTTETGMEEAFEQGVSFFDVESNNAAQDLYTLDTTPTTTPGVTTTSKSSHTSESDSTDVKTIKKSKSHPHVVLDKDEPVSVAGLEAEVPSPEQLLKAFASGSDNAAKSQSATKPGPHLLLGDYTISNNNVLDVIYLSCSALLVGACLWLGLRKKSRPGSFDSM